MSQIQANGQTLEYEDMGPREAPAIVLVMGLGMQLIAWPDKFCAALVERGFRVIRFDNRDIGLSSKAGHSNLLRLRLKMGAAMLRLPVRLPYTLEDMARDTLGLIDALGLQRAHVVGASMGGMIAQLLAIEHPERVASLTSMMSSTGRRGLPGPDPKVRRGLLKRRPKTRPEAIEYGVNLLRLIGSPGYPTHEAQLRQTVTRTIARSYHPVGFTRQLLAIIAAPDRIERLKTIRAPTLVLHGAGDPLISPAAAEDTAACIPGARLMIIPGWGHDLPEALLPTFATAIADHCQAAESVARGGNA